MSRIVSILGAESTGKTTLSLQLAETLRARGLRVALVAEYLREFCDERGRTPHRDEQAAIGAEQTRRIAAAAQTHELVIADTSAIMVAVYSELLFDDASLYAVAEDEQRRHAVTLLADLDLPWVHDAQRDGPHVRGPVMKLVQASLARAGVSPTLIRGSGQARLQAALAAVDQGLRTSA